MKLLLSLLIIGMVQPAKAEMITVNPNRVCASLVGVPYASDDFTDEQWVTFKTCRDFLQRFNGVK
jgi:hypothetical protein